MRAHKDSLRAQTHNRTVTPQGGPRRRDTHYLRPMTLRLSGSATVRADGRVMTPSLGFARVHVFSPVIPYLFFAALELAMTFSKTLFGTRTTRPLTGLIWPKDGRASIA